MTQKVDILIADDASLFRDFVKSAVNLVKINANFIEVSDGKKLFSAYEQHIPEITLVDSKLPNIDVLDFIKKIVGIHQIATIIVFVDSVEHVFVKQARMLGIEEILTKTIDQFSLGSLIKKHLDKKIPKYYEFEKKARSNVINALTLSTLGTSNETDQYVKLVNASIQKGIARIEKLKELGEDFDVTIKKISNGNSTSENSGKTSVAKSRLKFAPQDSPYFFMREFSNEELVNLLKDKIRQLKETKAELESVNNRLEEMVAELEETKQELTMQKEHLQEQVRLKTQEALKTEKLVTVGELAARIAHDLRNPLSVIKNTSQMLHLELGDHASPKTGEKWKRLDRAIYRMQHQLDDVLDYVRHTPLQKTQANLSTIISDAMERITTPDNIVVHPPLNDSQIYCDPTKLEVVFVNLIMNAIQAMEGRPGTIHILISDEQNDKDYIILEIRDTGPGIPEHLWKKIFDPLFTTRQIGTGLGLTSCKSIVERHGGTITFTSKIGAGTSFFIRLPKKTEWESIDDEPKGNLKLIT
jgi:signal transduction histidine kinase/DNA-binding NarL/FixJ family response regulator